MKLVFLDRLTFGNDIDLTPLEKFGELTIHETTNKEQTLSRVKDCDIVITNKVIIDKKIMDKSTIKLICIAATGTNNIDLEYAAIKNIAVKNVTDYSTSSVAQLTFTLALELIQKLTYYKNYVEKGDWQDSPVFTHINKPFFELKNKNWGIIGLGNIGKKVASIAKSFECNVNYYSTTGTNSNTTYNMLNLKELLSTSDIISIHCPLNNSTENLLNKTNLNTLKDGVILLNLGRGGIINEEDLAVTMDTKDLYCGLDVLKEEPIKKDNPLNSIKNRDKLIITPHVGWASIEARNKLLDGIINNIEQYVLKYV